MSENEQQDSELENQRTCQRDARFPNTNITNWCFCMFVDHQKCCRLLGEGSDCCEQFAKIYKAICPNEWISRWENQIEVGTFPVDLPPETNECNSKLSNIKK